MASLRSRGRSAATSDSVPGCSLRIGTREEEHRIGLQRISYRCNSSRRHQALALDILCIAVRTPWESKDAEGLSFDLTQPWPVSRVSMLVATAIRIGSLPASLVSHEAARSPRTPQRSCHGATTSTCVCAEYRSTPGGSHRHRRTWLPAPPFPLGGWSREGQAMWRAVRPCPCDGCWVAGSCTSSLPTAMRIETRQPRWARYPT
ncbi:uncharacterized protein PFL1_01332 [Pseudozyma flocculosa PF-1]|nr:uncharacterized protein PFL1_01332 [Pseudozyma flocculosa PF-1]EPQ31143.1 hypothetical protein PFL1_01332 [Pseudozyma flocculosa PF-1]